MEPGSSAEPGPIPDAVPHEVRLVGQGEPVGAEGDAPIYVVDVGRRITVESDLLNTIDGPARVDLSLAIDCRADDASPVAEETEAQTITVPPSSRPSASASWVSSIRIPRACSGISPADFDAWVMVRVAVPGEDAAGEKLIFLRFEAE